MAQIYLFTGENTFRLAQERRTWMREFAARHGEENMLRVWASDMNVQSFFDEIGSAPFIAERRLILIDGVPSFSKEEFEELPAILHPQVIVAFFDAKPDKRLGGVKILMKIAEVKEFAPVSGAPLARWCNEWAQNCGTSFQPNAIETLIRIVGEDQETLSHEIEKLALAGKGKPIDVVLVESHAVPSGEQEVWTLSNLIADGKRDAALGYARSLLERGEDAYSLWAILLWMLKNIVSVAAFMKEEPRADAGAIAKACGVPFPSARTLQPFCRSIPFQKLQSLVDWAADADVALKTGEYRSTQEAPEELMALIDECIFRCSSLKIT